MRPSSWALLRSPAASIPAPGSSPSLPALHSPALRPAPHGLQPVSFPTAFRLTRPLWGPQASPGPGGEQGREPAEAQAASAARGGSSTGGQWRPGGAPGRVQRGAWGQGQVCGVPWGFTTLGPTLPDLAVTTPHCADRAVTGPGLPPTSYPHSIRAAGQHARLLLPPHPPDGHHAHAGWSPYTPPPPKPSL